MTPKKKPRRAKDGSRRGGARMGSGRPKGRKTRPRRIENYEALGNAPSDSLAAMEWAHNANAVAMREVMLDKGMSPERRRAEIRSISRTMMALLPKVRLAQVERLLKGERAAEDAKKAGAALVPVPIEEPSPTTKKETT